MLENGTAGIWTLLEAWGLAHEFFFSKNQDGFVWYPPLMEFHSSLTI